MDTVLYVETRDGDTHFVDTVLYVETRDGDTHFETEMPLVEYNFSFFWSGHLAGLTILNRDIVFWGFNTFLLLETLFLLLLETLFLLDFIWVVQWLVLLVGPSVIVEIVRFFL